jgi:hypothetical protein
MRQSFWAVWAILAVALAPSVDAAQAQESVTYGFYQPLVLTQRPGAAGSTQHASFLRDVVLNLETVELAEKMIWIFGFTNRNPGAVGHFFFRIDEVYLLDEAGRRYDGVGPVVVRGDPRAGTEFAVPFPLPALGAGTFTVILEATHLGDHDEVPHGGHIWEAQVTLDESRIRIGRHPAPVEAR